MTTFWYCIPLDICQEFEMQEMKTHLQFFIELDWGQENLPQIKSLLWWCADDVIIGGEIKKPHRISAAILANSLVNRITSFPLSASLWKVRTLPAWPRGSMVTYVITDGGWKKGRLGCPKILVSHCRWARSVSILTAPDWRCVIASWKSAL